MQSYELKKIGVLGVRGLPASYGAFEQTISMLVTHNERYEFFISCENSKSKEDYTNLLVTRIFSKRLSGIGVVIYGLVSFLKQYILGVRVFLNFGYGVAIFFPLMKILGAKIACNVDGFEWRRNKWGWVAKKYFKLCEMFAAKFSDVLIFDSVVIRRYYSINHGRTGQLIYYGSDKISTDIPKNEIADYFLVVMRLEPENSILEIVKAFNGAKTRRLLLIVGPATKFFNSKVLPIIIENDRIRYLGPIYSRKVLAKYRKNCVAYIHGHTVGGVNPTLIEACDYSQPIFAINTRFNREVLGLSGNYFNTIDDLRELIEAVDQLKTVNAVELGKEFTWGYVSKQYFKLLERL